MYREKRVYGRIREFLGLVAESSRGCSGVKAGRQESVGTERLQWNV